MDCKHWHKTYLNAATSSRHFPGRVLYSYRCEACGQNILSFDSPSPDCAHPNLAPVRTEPRRSQCGKLVPTTIWGCPDCGGEFAVR